LLAKFYFLFVKAREVVPPRVLNRRMKGRKGLDEDFPFDVSATGAPGNLREQLERSLTEIEQDQKNVLFDRCPADIFAYLRAADDADARFTLGTNHRSDPSCVRAVNTVMMNVASPFLIDKIRFEPVGTPASAEDRLRRDDRPWSGLELVFKHFKTATAADNYRDDIVREGFENASVVPGCEYRVVVRGMENIDVAVELQAEAKRVRRAATIECIQGKDDVGELEVVFGHRRSRGEAEALVSRAAASGFVGLQIEPDACGGFEVMIKGFRDRNQASDFVSEAKSHGFDVGIEKS
jgi:hypothetical protein